MKSIAIVAIVIAGMVGLVPIVANAEARNLELMFQRDEPREFERYPEDIDRYIDAGGGWYAQFNWTTFWQVASDSKTNRDDLLNTTYNFSGAWEPLPESTVSWWFRGGRPIGTGTDTNLSTDIGSLLDVNGSLEDQALYIRELYWAQDIVERFRFSFGFIDSTWRYDFNTVANSELTHFVSLALINSPTIPFPESSIAVDGILEITDNTVFHVGLYQTNCDKDSLSCFNDLNGNDWLAPLEVIFTLDNPSWGQGNYRFLVFASENGDRRGGGVSMSLDQQIGRFTPFLRASFGDKEVTDVKQFFSIGVAVGRPLGRAWDMIGVGMAWSNPSDSGKRNESLVELYWRIRLNPFVSVTPDLQLVLDPANNPTVSRVVLGGVRLQVDF